MKETQSIFVSGFLLTQEAGYIRLINIVWKFSSVWFCLIFDRKILFFTSCFIASTAGPPCRHYTVTMATDIGSPQRFFHMPRFQHQAPRQVFYKRPDFAQQQAMQQLTFDGKRMRKAVNRKTIDYNPSVIRHLEVNTHESWVSDTYLSVTVLNTWCHVTYFCRTVCGSETIETSAQSSLTQDVTTMWVSRLCAASSAVSPVNQTGFITDQPLVSTQTLLWVRKRRRFSGLALALC